MTHRVRADLIDRPRTRRFALALLYLGEGAPIGYLWWALPTKLRLADLPVERIAALTALLTLPWTFKFLWAPLVDAFRSRRYGVKPWIVGAQAVMAATLVPLAFLDYVADYEVVVALLLVHATAASTQDCAIDALAIRIVRPQERGAVTGWMQTGMLLGRATFGGGALMLEGAIGHAGVVAALATTILCTGGVALIVPDVRGVVGKTRDKLGRVLRRLRTVAGRGSTWAGIFLAASAGAAMEATGALAGPLMVDLGWSQREIGWFFGLPAVAAMALGAILGGAFADRVPRSTGVTVGVTSVAVVVLALAGAVDAEWRWGVLALLSMAYLSFGILTATLYALLMDLTDATLGGTQFSTYMAAVNLCYVWSAAAAGQLAATDGYSVALVIMAMLSLASLVVHWFLRE